jgi:hypothetical protein
VSVKPGPKPTDNLDEVLSKQSIHCACPICLFPPEGRYGAFEMGQNGAIQTSGIPMPTNMVNTSYIAAYTMVSAALQRKPLLCRKGFHASGDFICEVNSTADWSGRWHPPYPTCVPDTCAFAPPPIAHQHIISQQECGSGRYNATHPFQHNTSCHLQCDPGYNPTSMYTHVDHIHGSDISCLFGTYSGFDIEPDGVMDTKMPECLPKYCDAKPFRNFSDIACTTDSNVLHTKCVLRCWPGYFYEGGAAT